MDRVVELLIEKSLDSDEFRAIVSEFVRKRSVSRL